jgi:hypothetical protein
MLVFLEHFWAAEQAVAKIINDNTIRQGIPITIVNFAVSLKCSVFLHNPFIQELLQAVILINVLSLHNIESP